MNPRRPRWRLRLALWALEWEWLWPALWPTTATLGAFVVLALFDVLPELPGWLHAAVLLGFAAGLTVTLRRLIARYRPADEAAARRRLERDSGLTHHPLEALDDRLAVGDQDATTRALWDAHRGRMAEAVRELTVRLPRAGLASRDPWGWRALLLLLLVAGWVWAGHDIGPRLGRALVPGLAPRLAAAAGMRIEVWLTPLPYTGQPQRLLKGGEGKLSVPAGTGVVVQMTGGGTAARLRIGEDIHPLTVLGAGSFRGEAAIESGDWLEIDDNGRTLIGWPMEVIPDAPPVVELTGAPEVSPEARLRFPFAARDDHGLNSLIVEARVAEEDRDDDDPEETAGIVRQDIALPGGDRRLVQGAASLTFAQHPWRGRRVAVTVIGRDARQQRGDSATTVIKLPERRFVHPVAKRLAELRARLTHDRARRVEVAEGLVDLAQNPADYGGDVVVHLALSVGHGRLLRDHRPEGMRSVKALLWDVALRLDDGGRSIAERDVQAARQALERALAEGADRAALDAALGQLREALDRYMRAVARELDRQGRSDDAAADAAQVLDAEAIDQFLARLRELSQQGAAEAARQMLAELRALLDNLENALAQPLPRPEDAARAKALAEALRDLARRQQELMDRGFRRLPEDLDRDGDPPSAEARTDNRGQAAAQDALRRDLDSLRGEMKSFAGSAPSTLDEAAGAMGEAVESLRADRPRDAVTAQGRAVDALRRGQGEMAQALSRALGGSGLRLGPGAGARRPFGASPFGTGGVGDSGDVTLPSELEAHRARALLDELRRRANQLDRPEDERRYLERLLKRF